MRGAGKRLPSREERACAQCGEVNPAQAKFCGGCGSRLDVGAAELGERRVTTVLFADLSGFTAYSEGVDIEEVRALAAECADALGAIVVHYGGTVDKVIGDCVMAVFGAPTSHEDDPERAVRAALDMQSYVTEHAERFARLPLSIGINTGETIWSPVGPDGRYTVLGDVVNTAARIQSAASRGTTLVGDSTYRATHRVIAYEPVEPIVAKNKAEPVAVWRATAIDETKRPIGTERPTLVGREGESQELWATWERVLTEHRTHLVTLVGPPGIGKSALIDATTARMLGAAQTYTGRCLAYGEGITYWPLIEIVKAGAGIHFDDTDEVVSAKLGFLLEHLGVDDLDELRTIAVAIANLVAVPTTPRGTYSAEKISRGELHWGVRRLFQLMARSCPLVLVFEDLHWAEPTLLDLLVSFDDDDVPAQILVVGSARPEIRDISGAFLTKTARRHVVELTALGAEPSRELIVQLLGEQGLGGSVDELVAAAAGNPLYLEEIARVLRDERSPDANVEGMLLSGSLRGLIGSRLDRLPDRDRRAAGRASVIGDVFWTNALTFVSETNGDIASALDSLEERDVVRAHPTSSISGEQEYGFTHGLVREVAYSRLTKAHRAQLHERCGAWIGALPGGDNEYAEIVAYHLEQACRFASDVTSSMKPPPLLGAASALRAAARKAQRREGTAEAARFYARAIELLGDRFPETSAELRLYYAETMDLQGEADAAAAEWSDVAELADRLGRADVRGRALVKLADFHVRHGRGTDAREHLTEARALARRFGDRDLEVRASVSLADADALFEGQTTSAVRDLRGAVALAEELDDPALELEARMHLGNQLYNMGRLAEAEESLDRALELAGAQGTFRDEARISQVLALVNFYLGRLDEAERLASRVLHWLERSQDQFLELQIHELLGKIALVNDDVGSSIQHLRDALELARAFGSWLVVDVIRYLAEATARSGDGAEASRIASEARQHLTHADPYMEAAVLLAEGAAARADGDVAAIRDRFGRALPLLEAQDLNLDLCEAQLAYARALRELREDDAARDELARVRDLARQLGADGLVAGAERELAIIASS